MLSSKYLVAPLLALLFIGCSDGGDPYTPPTSDGGTVDLGGTDGVVPNQDTGVPPQQCDCQPNQVCNTDGQCVNDPTPAANQGYAELVLLRQNSPGSTGILARLAKAEALLNTWEPKPQDKREHWTTWDGGDCAFEIDTTYPYWYDDKSWPSGPGLGAGKLTFKAQGAPPPGLIELEPLDLSSGGWAYFHDEVPPALKEGASTYADFFDPVNIPYGVPFEVQLAGGPDIGPMTITGGETAQDFAITQPAAEAPGAEAPNNAPLTVKWSPAQPGGTMEIFITQAFGMGSAALLTCTVRDDGETTIPAPALNNFIGEVGLQLRRNVIRYKEVQTASGQPMHVYLIGRHARLGSFTLTMP